MKKKQLLATAMSAACLVCIPLVSTTVFAGGMSPASPINYRGGNGGGNGAGMPFTPAPSQPSETTTVNSSNPLTFSEAGTTTYQGDVVVEDTDAITVDDGYLLTLIADGVEKEIEDGTTYEGPVEFVVTPELLDYDSPSTDVDFFNSFSGGGDGDYDFRAALFVTSEGTFTDDGTLSSSADGIVDDMSVTEAISKGSYDDSGAKGLDIESESDNFNGIMVVGSDYTISDSTFNFLSESDGQYVNDFSGYGAVISAFDGATVEVDNCTVNTDGVARLAFFSDGGSNMLIKDSSYTVDGGTLYDDYANSPDQSTMAAPPWVLGISGDARGTNLEGQLTSMTLVRVNGKARNWGVVSTDSGSNMLLNMVDMDMTLYGSDEEGEATTTADDDPYTTHYGSGYGTYAIGNAQEYFYGVHMNVGTYATIITGADLWYASSNFKNSFSPFVSKGTLSVYPITGTDSNDDATYDDTAVFTGITGENRKTIVNSDAFGVMAHGSGSITLTEGTEFHTDNAAFLIRNVSQNITVEDKSVVDVADGTILQMIDNDDSQIGMDTASFAFYTEFNEAEGYPGIDYTPGGAYASNGNTVTFTAEDVTLTGNLYNGTGYYGSGPAEDDGLYSDNQGSAALAVTLKDKASLKGDIASTSYIHVDENGDQNTYFTIDQYFYLGHVANELNYNGYNDVSVTLESGSSWTVTNESLIQSLTLEDGATLKAKVTVDGESVALSDLQGTTTTGEIILTPASSQQVAPSPVPPQNGQQVTPSPVVPKNVQQAANYPQQSGNGKVVKR